MREGGEGGGGGGGEGQREREVWERGEGGREGW